MLLQIETTSLIEWGGILIIALLIFAETGLLLGLIIPGGETLIFAGGLLVSTGSLGVSLPVYLCIIILAGITGDTSGFYIGRKLGPRLHQKEDTWYFKKKYLVIAEDFLKKHRKTALIFGKFFPVIRPFLPVISGATAMRVGSFIPISIIAGFYI